MGKKSESEETRADCSLKAVEESCSLEHVRHQMYSIEKCLTKVLFGDYGAVVALEEGDPMWGNLAMHINVAINAARNAIQRAEKSESLAAQSRDEALAAAKAESRFLTNITHELRTPLASIRASAEILRDFDPESVDTNEFGLRQSGSLHSKVLRIGIWDLEFVWNLEFGI